MENQVLKGLEINPQWLGNGGELFTREKMSTTLERQKNKQFDLAWSPHGIWFKERHHTSQVVLYLGWGKTGWSILDDRFGTLLLLALLHFLACGVRKKERE